MSDIVIHLPRPHPGQLQVISEASRFNVLACGRRWGKMICLNTLIPTINGYKPLSTIKLGDQIFGADGQPTTIVGLSPIDLTPESYEITFSNGEKVTACADHQWFTWTHAARKAAKRVKHPGTNRLPASTLPQVRTTKELLTTLTHSTRKDINHSIKVVSGPLQYSEKELAVMPYTLGAWLGDGSRNAAVITSMDEEVIGNIREEGYRVDLFYEKENNKASGYIIRYPGDIPNKINSFAWNLKNAGVWNNKHVPDVYLQASSTQRLALLQGLMDTDGTVSTGGHCCFDNTNEQLRDAVFNLLASLGCQGRKTQRRAKLYGEDHGLVYRVKFTPHIPVFRLSRKLERLRLDAIKSSYQHLYITDIQPVTPVPMRCISVDAPDHLFLITRSCIPTHNSTLGLDRVVGPALEGYPVAWFAPSYKILQELWRMSVAILRPVTKARDAQQHRLDLKTGGVLEMWSLDTPDSARGRKYKRIVVDEAAMVPELEEAWQMVMRPTLADYQGDAWFLSSPKGLNYFWDMYCWGQDPLKAEWRSWSMPTITNPFIPGTEVEAMRREMPSQAFGQEILAQFIGDGVGVFRKIHQAATAAPQLFPQPGHQYVIGVDWGRATDFTVFAVFDITTKTMVALERTNEVEFAIQRLRLGALIRTWRPITVIAEANSIGTPIIEELNRDDFRIQPWIMTNASKALAVDAFALALEQEEVRVLDDVQLIKELNSFVSERTASGMVRYRAPGNQHDDMVIATILAWQGVESASDGVLEYYRRNVNQSMGPQSDKPKVLGPAQAALLAARKRRYLREIHEELSIPTQKPIEELDPEVVNIV